MKINYICGFCQKPFSDYSTNIKRTYCSFKCKGKAQSIKYKGENNPCWRGGVWKIKNKCSNCGKEVWYRSKMCNDCALRLIPRNFKDGFSEQRAYRNRKIIEGLHSIEEWENLKKTYRYMCLCCKRKEPEIKLTKDHIIPVIEGGTNDIWNIQPLCKSCNSQKHTNTTDYRKEVL